MPIAPQLGVIDPEAREVVESLLKLARERLGMDIAWLAEFTVERGVFRVVDGDREDWNIWEDDWMPVAESYCNRMLLGLIPNAIPDVPNEPALADLVAKSERRIGAYVGVPLVLRDGTMRGAFCCASHTPALELSDRDVRFMEVLARLAGDELSFREALRRMRVMERRSAAAEALCAALEARDDYTGSHSAQVVALAGAVARRLGCDGEAVAAVEQVALLHDIGKVGVPDAILRKPSALDPEEWRIMRRHPEIGADILRRVPALAEHAPAVRAEHEQWDGDGYPDGLSGEAIPLPARIVLVCDGYHAMVSDRPYRRALSPENARAELLRCSGGMFWPDAVDALLAEIDERA
jgi:putative nucleotidyltransferase with HDIG domain